MPGASTPTGEEQTLLGLCPVRGYTHGPAFCLEGWSSLEALAYQRTPVIVCTAYFEPRMLEKIDLTRVRGFVVEHGSLIDPLWTTLAELSKPSLIGVPGLLAAVAPGDMACIDGGEASLVLRPRPARLRKAERQRGLRPPAEPPALPEILGKLANPIREAWVHSGHPTPYDVPEQRRLYAIAHHVARGGIPTPADDALLHDLLFVRARSDLGPRYIPKADSG